MNRVSDPLLLQHMKECADARKDLREDFREIREGMKAQDAFTLKLHEENLQARLKFQEEVNRALGKVMFWLITTLVTAFVGAIGAVAMTHYQSLLR